MPQVVDLHTGQTLHRSKQDPNKIDRLLIHFIFALTLFITLLLLILTIIGVVVYFEHAPKVQRTIDSVRVTLDLVNPILQQLNQSDITQIRWSLNESLSVLQVGSDSLSNLTRRLETLVNKGCRIFNC